MGLRIDDDTHLREVVELSIDGKKTKDFPLPKKILKCSWQELFTHVQTYLVYAYLVLLKGRERLFDNLFSDKPVTHVLLMRSFNSHYLLI